MFFAKIYNLLNFVMNVVKTEGENMDDGLDFAMSAANETNETDYENNKSRDSSRLLCSLPFSFRLSPITSY